ncbi:virulence factor TspB C-terminal domain-related protein [Acinetobacter colistiniresistens]|uniref:virulence factor TspB C-terminal domain-related protein n=1 Tax=Acinetobacter colistiniresistens TaxID=280145 RepID=UPI000BDFA4A3|nr:virulence factor TspB C-terminal domain-related protein [Acinetobacter colistiniresistens]
MRFFKYLVLFFLSFFSLNASAYYAWNDFKDNSISGVVGKYCGKYLAEKYYTKCSFSSVLSDRGEWIDVIFKYNRPSDYDQSKPSEGTLSVRRVNNCPAAGEPLVVWLPYETNHIPVRLCNSGCTATGAGRRTDMNNVSNTIMSFTGETTNCTNEYKDDPPPKCDKTDPYGECFVPPDDKCVRLSNGSIECPNANRPPQNNTCNGATYCKKPPEGCKSGYVPGSFNGEDLCVRSGPNTPKNPNDDNPKDPNNCMNGGSYCQQPPNNDTCPYGYYETTYNGSKICVKDNPDPNKPNPNDPTGGKGPSEGGGGDDGGGSSEPTGGDGSTGSINLKPVIDAINSLKNSLLNAISGIAGKIDLLINGQRDTNLKLDTSNEHLDKIEDSTQATSDAVGDIRDFIKKKEPLPEHETKVQVDKVQVPEPTNQQYLGWSPSCPMQAKSNQLVINGISVAIESDFTPTCEMALAVRPFVLAAGAIIAFLIASGVWMGRGDN